MISQANNGSIWSSKVSSFFVNTGSYIGNGSSQQIYMPFAPQFIIIDATGSTTNDDTIISWSGMVNPSKASPAARTFHPLANPTTGRITSYNIDGFTVGSDVAVNTNGQKYNYVAIGGQNGVNISTGVYTSATAVTGRTITCGFRPRIVFLTRTDGSTQPVVLKTESNTGDLSFRYDAALTGLTKNNIISLNATSFVLGGNAAVVAAGRAYSWCAMLPPTGICEINTYVGDAVDNKIITTNPDFFPNWVLIKGDTNNEMVMRGENANTGDETSVIGNSLAVASNIIQSHGYGNFELGTSARSNTSGSTYHYVAMKTN